MDDWLSDLGKEWPDYDPEAIVNDLRALPLLVVRAPEVHFVHKSFLVFAVAYHLWREPRRLIEVADLGGPDRMDLLRHAAWLSDEIGPLVDACLQRNWLVEAGACISWSRAENGALADLVAQRIRTSVGEKFFERLRPAPPEPAEDDLYRTLLTMLDEAGDATLANHVRGRKFEDFAAKLFSHGFEVIARNRNTTFGEFDLSLEILGNTGFWLRWDGDAIVECKNRVDASEVADVNAFASKVDLAGVRLAFFLSVAGFTKPARDTMNRLALKTGRPLLVPLTGEEVRRMLEQRESIEGFFKRSIRRVRHCQPNGSEVGSAPGASLNGGSRHRIL